MEQSIDDSELEKIERDPPEDRGPSIREIPDLMVIDARHDRTEYVGTAGVHAEPTLWEKGLAEKYGIPIEELMGVIEQRLHVNQKPVPIPCGDADAMDLVQHKVNAATKMFTGNIIQVMRYLGTPIDSKVTPGMVKRSINAQWNRVSDSAHRTMDMEGFMAKNAWLQQENSRLRHTKELPSWLAL
jgi:hypothetical protein